MRPLRTTSAATPKPSNTAHIPTAGRSTASQAPRLAPQPALLICHLLRKRDPLRHPHPDRECLSRLGGYNSSHGQSRGLGLLRPHLPPLTYSTAQPASPQPAPCATPPHTPAPPAPSAWHCNAKPPSTRRNSQHGKRPTTRAIVPSARRRFRKRMGVIIWSVRRAGRTYAGIA